jgi:hypothetical protein
MSYCTGQEGEPSWEVRGSDVRGGSGVDHCHQSK